jgi:hypothetical protein
MKILVVGNLVISTQSCFEHRGPILWIPHHLWRLWFVWCLSDRTCRTISSFHLPAFSLSSAWGVMTSWSAFPQKTVLTSPRRFLEFFRSQQPYRVPDLSMCQIEWTHPVKWWAIRASSATCHWHRGQMDEIAMTYVERWAWKDILNLCDCFTKC